MAPASSLLWPRVAGAFAFLLGAVIAAASAAAPEDLLPRGLLRGAASPEYAAAFGLGTGFVLAAAGLCLFGGLAMGRGLFVWAVPLGAVALAGRFPDALWRDDLPLTTLGVALFAPLVLLCSRPRAQAALGRSRFDWRGRGGTNVVLSLLVYGGLYAWVASSQPETGGPEVPGLAELAWPTGLLLRDPGVEFHAAKRATTLVLLAYAAGALVAVSIPCRVRAPDPARREGSARDEFRLIGFMKFYLVIQILAPLFLIGLTIWAVNEPGLELTKLGPFILVGLGIWAIWEFVGLVRYGGFTVVVTDEHIAVGSRRVAWADVTGASVQAAVKFDTWIEIRPKQGEPLAIPAAIGRKDQLLTLVEKHHPELVRKK